MSPPVTPPPKRSAEAASGSALEHPHVSRLKHESLPAADMFETPRRATTASLLESEYTCKVVLPFVKQNVVNHRQKVSLKHWLQAVFGIKPDDFQRRVDEIESKKWFDNAVINQALRTFCQSTFEPDRYEPFCTMANEVLRLAREKHSGLQEFAGKFDSFPVWDITFVRNDPVIFQVHPDHGTLGAERKPDVVSVREKATKNSEDRRLEWVSCLACIEFKKESIKRKINCKRLPLSSQPVIEPQGGEGREEKSRKRPRSQSGSKTTAKKARLASGSGVRTGSGPLVVAAASALYQSATYALEVLAATDGTRAHYIGMIVDGDRLSLWYYDASGIVSTSDLSLSIIDDFEKTAAILVTFASSNAHTLGALPPAVSPRRKYPDSFPPDNLANHSVSLYHADYDPANPTHAASKPVKVTLFECIFRQYALVGRRTIVYTAKVEEPGLKDKGLVVKMSYQVSTRKPEQTFIKIARDAKVEHLPELYLVGDIWKLSDGIRNSLNGLGVEGGNFEDRILRGPVYKQYQPLKALFGSSSKYLGRMVYQMLSCMDDLWSKAHILHRDISVNNILWELDERGEPHFILNDFDLATVVAEDGQPKNEPSSNHRTGTLPFLSLDVLKDLKKLTLAQEQEQPLPPPVRHLLRFDFKSLLWAALWCASNMEEDVSKVHKKAVASIIREWENQSFQAIADSKTALLHSAEKQMEFPFSPKFEPWREWFSEWMDLLSEGQMVYSKYAKRLDLARRKGHAALPESFDWETLDGHFTKDAILNVLKLADIEEKLA